MKLMLAFAASLMVSSIVSYLYGTVDSMMVGRFVNPSALAAVSQGSGVLAMVEYVFLGVTSGYSIIVGDVFGSGDRKRLREMMANIVYMQLILTAILVVVGFLFCDPLLDLIHTPDDIKEGASEYVRTYFATILAYVIPWIMGGAFRGLGDSRTPLILSLVSGAGNVLFDYLFIVVFDLGVSGAALGTACANLVSSALYLYFFFRKMPLLHFGRADAKINLADFRRLLRFGIPLGLQNAITHVGALMLTSAINGHPEEIVVGVATGNRTVGFMWTILAVFASSISCFAAQNHGAGNMERVRAGTRQILFFTIGVAGTVAAICVFGGRWLSQLFVGSDGTGEIVEWAWRYILVQVAFFPCMAMLYVWRAAVQGIGYSATSMLCGVIELIARLTVSIFFSDNIWVLFFAGPAAWVGTSIFLGILFPKLVRKMEKQHERHRPTPEKSAT